MTAPAEQLRAAAKILRSPLPPYYQGTARTVIEESAFLVICPYEHDEGSTCESCELIEVHHEAMADLLAALFNAREPLAAWLDDAAEVHKKDERIGANWCRYCAELWPCGDSKNARAAAATILGEAS